MDYSGRRRRPAQAVEAELLPNRKVVAPVRLEKALRAKHGLEPWTEDYSDLAPSNIPQVWRAVRGHGRDGGDANVSVRTISDQLGHAKVSMTQDR